MENIKLNTYLDVKCGNGMIYRMKIEYGCNEYSLDASAPYIERVTLGDSVVYEPTGRYDDALERFSKTIGLIPELNKVYGGYFDLFKCDVERQVDEHFNDVLYLRNRYEHMNIVMLLLCDVDACHYNAIKRLVKLDAVEDNSFKGLFLRIQNRENDYEKFITDCAWRYLNFASNPLDGLKSYDLPDFAYSQFKTLHDIKIWNKDHDWMFKILYSVIDDICAEIGIVNKNGKWMLK